MTEMIPALLGFGTLNSLDFLNELVSVSFSLDVRSAIGPDTRSSNEFKES